MVWKYANWYVQYMVDMVGECTHQLDGRILLRPGGGYIFDCRLESSIEMYVCVFF